MNKLPAKTPPKIKCLKCGTISERPICDTCVSKAVDKMAKENWDDVVKCAKLGMIALVDEATEYQKVRAKDELYQLYFKYL